MAEEIVGAVRRDGFVDPDDEDRTLTIIRWGDDSVHLSVRTRSKQVGFRIPPDARQQIADLITEGL